MYVLNLEYFPLFPWPQPSFLLCLVDFTFAEGAGAGAQGVWEGGLKSNTCHSLLWVRWKEMERRWISRDFLADHSPRADVNNIPGHSTLSLIF